MAQEMSEQNAVVADPRSAPATPNTPNKIRGVLHERARLYAIDVSLNFKRALI